MTHLNHTLDAIAQDLNAGRTVAGLGRIHRLLARLSAGKTGYGRAAWLSLGAIPREATGADVWAALELHAPSWLEASDEEKAAQEIRRARARQALRALKRASIQIRRAA